jgi:AcrR family transcriptional regulator
VTMAISPRKAPKQARGRATRDAIVEAAAHIVSRGGLAAYNTNAVAERAGVSIGSLYQYFPNKDALMVALIDWQQSKQLQTLKATIDSIDHAPDMEVMIRSLVRAAMNHHHEDELLASAIDHEEARLPVGNLVGGYLDKGGELVAALLGRFQEDIAPTDPLLAARTLPVIVRAVTDAWANLDPPQLTIAEDEAVRVVLGYLGKSNERSTQKARSSRQL